MGDERLLDEARMYAKSASELLQHAFWERDVDSIARLLERAVSEIRNAETYLDIARNHAASSSPPSPSRAEDADG
jgi:hypothetical protein